MEKSITLETLTEGQYALVTAITSSGSIRRRLQDLGIVEGTLIQCVHKSPAGDPVAFLIRGAIIALRSEDSSSIRVNLI